MIQFFKNLFSTQPEIIVHIHDWTHQYETGTHHTKWEKEDGQIGFSRSDVYKCDCGQWSVKHRSDKKNEYIFIK